MIRYLLLPATFLMVHVLGAAPPSTGSLSETERPDWQHYFTAQEATGTLVVWDERIGGMTRQIFHPARAQQRFCPASTFKIPHTLFALDAGILRDEFQIFLWDGEKREIEAWNRDHNVRSAMRNSVVWVYQKLADSIGLERARQYLARLGYGNVTARPDGDGYWLNDSLQISAHEQVGFLRQLYYNQLPFAVEHQLLVKDVMITEAGPDWILRAKTGWTGTIGWWVGWVEWPDGPVFFALNIDTPKGLPDLPKCQAIVRAILQSINALPQS